MIKKIEQETGPQPIEPFTIENYATVQLLYVGCNVGRVVDPLHLICYRGKDGSPKVPVRLGRGRFATVVAAADGPLETAGVFFALKFLSMDKDSTSFSRNARRRYYSELQQNHSLRVLNAGISAFVGFSRIKAQLSKLAFSGVDRNPEEDAFEQDYVKAIEEAAQSNEASKDALEPDFWDQIQGEFFVMRAEEGSLDDFFLDSRAWICRPLAKVSRNVHNWLEKGIGDNHKELDAFLDRIRETKVSEADRERRKANPAFQERTREFPRPSNASALSILSYIGLYAPSIKNLIATSYAQSLASRVSDLHRAEPAVETSLRRLAHRDLKLGNFLFSMASGRLVLTDLGFASSTTKDNAASLLHISGREAGAQALGSRLCRAPEQRDTLPPPEIKFRILKDRSRVEFFDLGGLHVEPGDVFESQEIKFPNDGQKARITRVKVDSKTDRIEVTLDNEICDLSDPEQDTDYLGYIIKEAGQHTDVFAIGCIFYFLATGGRNPEEFYDVCLRNSIDQEIEESCLSLALALCSDNPASIQKDLRAYLDTETLKDARATYDSASRIHRSIVLDWPAPSEYPVESRRGFWHWLFGKADRQVKSDLNSLVKKWRESPAVASYNCDKNGYPLPFPIMYEVIRCMVRDKEDSLIRRKNPSEESYFDQDLSGAANELAGRLRKLTDELPSLKNGEIMGVKSAIERLEMLRVCWLPRIRQDGSTEELQPSAPARSAPDVVPGHSRADGNGGDHSVSTGDRSATPWIDRSGLSPLLQPAPGTSDGTPAVPDRQDAS